MKPTDCVECFSRRNSRLNRFDTFRVIQSFSVNTVSKVTDVPVIINPMRLDTCPLILKKQDFPVSLKAVKYCHSPWKSQKNVLQRLSNSINTDVEKTGKEHTIAVCIQSGIIDPCESRCFVSNQLAHQTWPIGVSHTKNYVMWSH